MVDLTREMSSLMASLGRPPAAMGRVLLFVSAFSGEGVSTITREYARCEAAYAKRPVWLVDADLQRQEQLRAVIDDGERFGMPGSISKASPDGSVFFRLSPEARGEDDAPINESSFLIARPFLQRRLWVTRLLRERLPPGSRVRIAERTNYWQALREHAQTVVIDAPAFDRSHAALHMAPLVDGVILVVSENDGEVEARLELRDAIEGAGGRLLGMVYNRARHLPAKTPASSVQDERAAEGKRRVRRGAS